MGKIIKIKGEATKNILDGVNILADAVKITLGPKGKNALIEDNNGEALVTNDGITVAEYIEINDEIANIGAKVIRDVASKTNEISGDGTSTATVLAQDIINNGFALVDSGHNPIILRDQMKIALDKIIKSLEDMTISIDSKEDLIKVATISCANDKMGELIAEAIYKVGKEGVVNIEESKNMNTTLEIKEGLCFDRGYCSPFMITDTKRKENIYLEPYIFVTDMKLDMIEDILPMLEEVSQEGRRLVLIVDDIGDEALATLVVNKLQNNIDSVVIKAPSFGDNRVSILEDISIVTGAKFFSSSVYKDLASTMDNFSVNDLGSCEKIHVTKENTAIIKGRGLEEDVNARIEQIRLEIEETESDYEKENLEERLAKLTTGIAVIKVGAATEMELKENKLRIEDGVNATKAALEGGIVPGGGIALFNIYKEYDFNNKASGGEKLLYLALKKPLQQIILNSGKSLEEEKDTFKYLLNCKCNEIGYDAYNDCFVHMIEAGIIDPGKVTKNAIINAVSIASTLLTTDVVIVNSIE